MEPLQYRDFDLKIERKKGKRYNARVLPYPGSLEGEASWDFKLPFTGDRLELLVLKLGSLHTHVAEMEAARELGGGLFEAVFGGEVRVRLRSSLDEMLGAGTGLRLKLRLQEVPELADLPWEFLFDTSLGRFFAQSIQTPIVRYIEISERIKPITVNLPLHLLVVISSPSGYPRLDVEREMSILEEALDSLIKDKKVCVEYLENPTLTDIMRYLQGGEYHVLHFIGHGGFDKKREKGVLILEDKQGRGGLADAQQISAILHDHPSLRLIVLNSCEGARNSLTDPFAGVAAGLIRQGVPAVVAMQFEITDEAAITFAGEFYAALAGGFPVDAAVAEARKVIYSTYSHNDIEWGTPVLYMRSSDGVLFDLTQKPAAEATPAPEPELVVSTTPGEPAVASPEHETVPDHEQAILKVLESHRDQPDIFVAPNIPRNKLVNAITSCEVPRTDRILGLIDCTVLGSAKNCLLIGRDAIYYHNDWASSQPGTHKISYEQFVQRMVQPRLGFFELTEVLLGYDDSVEISGCSLNKAAVVSLLWEVQDAIKS